MTRGSSGLGETKCLAEGEQQPIPRDTKQFQRIKLATPQDSTKRPVVEEEPSIPEVLLLLLTPGREGQGSTGLDSRGFVALPVTGEPLGLGETKCL